MKKKIVISALLLILVASSLLIIANAAQVVTLWVDGKQIKGDIKNVNGSNYVPLRMVSEALGANVIWDAASQKIIITPKDGTPPKIETKPTTDTKPVAIRKIGDPTTFNYSVNSADGVTLSWLAKNNTGKRIKYYNVIISTYNPVNDPSSDQLTGESTFTLRYVGPIEIEEDLIVYKLFTYQSALEIIKIDQIELEYMDGTKETVKYGLKTADDSGME